tara:strand:+ start:933 stop:1139 length:207 start_codon:yes stop_codon:yes gene_type:complete
LKVNGSTTAQQINWQKIANDKQQNLENAAKGQALKKIKEEQQFEIYNQVANKQQIQQATQTKRVDVVV